MNAIFKKDNVFVYVTDIPLKVWEIQEVEPSYVIDVQNAGYEKYLYGGRVKIEFFYYKLGAVRLFVDGIEICNGSRYLEKYLTIEAVVCYLNQMEILGVDTFLDNYKKALHEFKEELSILENKIEGSLTVCKDEDIRKKDEIKEIHFHVSSLIHDLTMHIPVGIDDDEYERIYHDITSRYQE